MKTLLFCIAVCGVLAGIYGVAIYPETSSVQDIYTGQFNKNLEMEDQAELLIMVGFGIAAVFGIGGVALAASEPKSE